jgi:hypothetical protein
MDSTITGTGARTRRASSAYRTTAVVVGLTYLAGFVVGIGGEGLIQSILGQPDRLSAVSAGGVTLGIGAILWLMAVVGDAAHGVLMFPILKLHGERLAVGYLAARILDALFIAIMVLFMLLQIPLAREYASASAPDATHLQSLSNVLVQASKYAYQLGMSTLGLAGLTLCYTLYKAHLVPRPLAIWGLVGYAIIFLGMVSEFMGSGLELASSIPGGLWEVFIGGWLIAKGFRSPDSALKSAATAATSPAPSNAFDSPAAI